MIYWKSFLTRWSQQLTKTGLAKRIDPPSESTDWLGFAPATEDDVTKLEKNLGVILPPSYRAFLLTTNGWRRTTPFIGRIRPAAEVNWFRVENEQWAEIYSENGSDLDDTEYYVYDENGAPDHRAKHMRSLIQISDVEDGVYLLNPKAVTPDGEWEAWFFANWMPGAARHPSFAHLMLHEYQTFTKLEKVTESVLLPLPPTPGPNVPRVPAERLRKRSAKAPPVEALIAEMQSSDSKSREKATKTFFGKLKGRPRAERRPDLIEPLNHLFYSSPDPNVRSACVQAITELAEDGSSPRPLFDSLVDPDAGVILSGMFALSYFPDPRAWEPLCRFIESRANVLFNETAMSQLGQMRDERAVPTLTRVLLNTSSTFDQGFGTAAMALGRSGPRGFEVLTKAIGHTDARIRLAAVVGLDISGDPRAAAYLDQMESDPDSRIRERAKVRMGDFYFK
jgi:cell wall assembly regulator SMI1